MSAADFQSYLAPTLRWFCEPDVNGQQYGCWQVIFHMYCKEYDDCTRQPPFYNALVLGLNHVLCMLLPGVPARQVYSTGELRGRAAYEGTSSTVQASDLILSATREIRDSLRPSPTSARWVLLVSQLVLPWYPVAPSRPGP